VSRPDVTPPGGGADRHPAPSRPPQIRPWHLQKLALVYVRQSSIGQVRDNTGSTAVQRDLAELPLEWGWPPALIETIDQDQAKSGTSTTKRVGFQRLLESVEQGQVGLVLVRDLSRLSRNATDYVRFVDAARRAQILVYADDQLYDMATDNDAELFFRIIQGLLAWLDNANRVRQFRAARVAKARQGHAVSRPPIGYVKGVHGQWVKDPDPEVQKIIGQIFQLALTLRSIGAVVTHMQTHKLRFPRRHRGVLTWGPPSRARLHSVLTNPRYTNDYVYQRVRIIPGTDGTARRIEPRPDTEWTVSEGHHEAYVTKEDWRLITAALAARRPAVRPIVGKGDALLQGLLRCGECQRWLRTEYSVRDGQARGASYVCRPKDQEGKPRHRIGGSARLVDQVVVREILAKLAPVEIDHALAVIDSATFEEKAIQRSHQRQLQQAEEEAERAHRTFQQVTESSRRVRIAAEQKWEQALEHVETLKRDLARTAPPIPVTITPGDAAELRALTERIPELWAVATNEDRKQLLRTVVTEIIVQAVTKEAVDLEIVWVGGLRQRLRALRPAGVDQVVAAARKTGKDPATIATELRGTDIATRRGTPMQRPAVYGALKRVGLNSTEQRRQVLMLIRQLIIDRRPRPEMLKIVQEQAPPALGPWTGQRLNQCVSKLYQGVSGIPPLPKPLPAEQDKQAAIDLIRRRHDERATWSMIAVELNASGLGPPRASAFTATQVARLFSRSQRQRPQDGPGGMAPT
jgi:DNA invertase Pin-like site-specific DNA recombinase